MFILLFESLISFHFLCFRLGSTPELTGNVITPAFMGAPVILIEKLFSGRESISAAEAASAILRAGGAINEQDNGDGIREAKDVQDWMSSKSEVQAGESFLP